MASINELTTKKCRTRSANWESIEKSLFKECLKEHLSIIECKACDTNANAHKQMAWNQILQRFNELNHRQRSMAELKCQWRKVKRLNNIDDNDDDDTLDRFRSQLLDGDSNNDTIEDGFIENENELTVTPANSCTTDEQENEIIENENNHVEASPACLPTIEIRPLVRQQEVRKPRAIFKRAIERKKIAANHVREKDKELIECLREESKLKMKQMIEAHQWAKEEHKLKMNTLRLKYVLLKKYINDDDNSD